MGQVGLVPFQGVHLEEYSKDRYLRLVPRRMDMEKVEVVQRTRIDRFRHIVKLLIF
jgi:hypothetical protein